MSSINARHILDQQTLTELDAEFQAGVYDGMSSPSIPELIPFTDPFEMDYQWLDPVNPVSEVLPACLLTAPETRLKLASNQMRSFVNAGLLAGATDQELFVEWVNGPFLAQCSADGHNQVIDSYRQQRGITAGAVEFIIETLEKRPRFDEFSLEDKVTIAVAILDSIR